MPGSVPTSCAGLPVVWRVGLPSRPSHPPVDSRSYSDLNRAHVIRARRAQNMLVKDIALLLGISKRRVLQIQRLFDLPEVAQTSVDHPEHRLGLDTAILIGRFANRVPDLDWSHWVGRVQDENLSFGRLKRALIEEYPAEPTPKERVAAVLRQVENLGGSMPVKLDKEGVASAISEMTEEERRTRVAGLRRFERVARRLREAIERGEH